MIQRQATPKKISSNLLDTAIQTVTNMDRNTLLKPRKTKRVLSTEDQTSHMLQPQQSRLQENTQKT